MGEINLYGVYLPVFIVQAVLAYMILKCLIWGITPDVEQQWIALPSVFYLCLYIILIGMVHVGFLLCCA